MINHLLDLNAAKTPGDQYPSVAELVKKFKVRFRWVVSIGFALRSDVTYPDDLCKYGSCEAEQKFNWIVAKYEKITALMKRHTLIMDFYGPGTTWFVRKNIAFRSPHVTGQAWMAVGDATGFTNPLYSPGINCNMATSIFAADITKDYLAAPDARPRKQIFDKYEMFCNDRIPNLQRMSMFNYILMRTSSLGPLGPLWQYLIGTGNANFQNARAFKLENCARLLITWDWGANEQEYIKFASMVCKMLDGPSDEKVSEEKIENVRQLSAKCLAEVVTTGKYKGRFGGLLRFYDDDLVYNKDKIDRDLLARRCVKCGEWKLLSVEVRNCAFCGWQHTAEESMKRLYDE